MVALYPGCWTYGHVPMSEDVFERLGLWPIRLQFIEKEGFSLWGSGNEPDGPDLVLSAAGRVLLVPTLEELRQYVVRDTSSAMADLRGYAELRDLLRDESLRISPALAVNYTHTLARMAKPSADWTSEGASDVLDALNMLSDIVRVLKDHDVEQRFRYGVYRALVNELTFVEVDEIAAALADLDLRQALETLLHDVQHVEQNVGPA